VRLLLRIDRDGRMRYAPLQSPAAQAFLAGRGLPTRNFDSLVFVTDWSHRDQAPYFERTAGVIAALRACGSGWRVFGQVMRLIPMSWRDALYRWVGRTRYRWCGPWKSRPLARAEWARRFVG
jgi:predicted DCC family thiol-disulfide oxidoreductase YuxK